MNDKYKVKLIYGSSYIKDPRVPRVILGDTFASQNELRLFTERLSPFRFQGCGSGGWGTVGSGGSGGQGLSDWGLHKTGGGGALFPRRKSGKFIHVLRYKFLGQNVPFSLWSYLRVFLLATAESPLPPFSGVSRTCSWSGSWQLFPLSLLCSLLLVFTELNSSPQLSIQNLLF